MDSERVPATTGKQGSRMRGLFLILLALLLVLFACVAWLLGTAGGARVAFAAIEHLSDGALRAEGVGGRLAGALRLDRIVVDTPNRRLVLSNVLLDWRPQALLEKRLHLTRLHVAHVAVTNADKKQEEPPKLPDRIAAPIDIQADDVQIQGGELRRGEASLAGFGPIALGLDFDGARYRVQLRRLEAAAAQAQGGFSINLQGQATLSATAPYALQGSFSVGGKANAGPRAVSASGKIGLGGSLAESAADIALDVNEARLAAKATLQPFTAEPLGKVQLSARALDLSLFDAAWPRTALDIDLSKAQRSGELQLRNADAGTYDEKKVPLSALSLAFRREATQWLFEHIDARLGTPSQPAGTLTGQGRLADGALDLSLLTEALDLKRVDRRLRSTRLAGKADLRHADSTQTFSLSLSEPLGAKRVTLDARATMAGNALTVERLDMRAGSGRLEASGRAQLDGSQDFDAKAVVSRFRLEDLGSFPQVPSLELNGNLELSGKRQPSLEADLAFHIADSRLAGQALTGDGKAQLRGERLQVPHFRLDSGANRLNIEGELADGGAELSFALDAPQLRQFGPAFGGALQASGIVSGSMNKPRLRAQWKASQARLPAAVHMDAMDGTADIAINRERPFILDSAVADISASGLRYGGDRLARAQAQLRFAPPASAPLALTLRAEGIATSRLLAERLTATANGTTGNHAIDLVLVETGQSWSMKASGGLASLERDPQWKGNIDGFDARGRFVARLAEPAPLFVSAQRLQLDRFLLDMESGRVAVERFTRDAKGMTTRGRIEHLQVVRLLQLISPATQAKGDLLLGGEWDLRLGDTLDGAASLRREGGDLILPGNTPITLGLRNLLANAILDNGKLAVQMQADGQRLGRIDFNARTVLGDGASRLAIAPEAPLAGSARIEVPSLAWAGVLLPPSMTIDGSLQSQVSVNGTFSQPRLGGRITGDALRFSMRDLGIDLRQGVLDSEFQGNQLMIRQLRFQGVQGTVTVSGPVDVGGGQPAAQLTLVAERFALLNRADRRIVISGTSQYDWKDQQGKLSGGFAVDSGFIDLGRADKPQLSRDVVIVGQEKKQARKTALALDVAISLGDGVKVVGRGLDATLGGGIRITSDAGEVLQGQGAFHAIKGTYTAYGRELDIEQGALRFRGSISNPSLDILAMRRGQEVEAGVSVRGNVLAPRVTLVSEPNVPDADKLSWLVLGRGLSTASGEADAGALQAAAATLLSQGAQAGASAFGLDTLSVGTSEDSLQQRIVTLGKQISSKLYVSYQQGLETAGSVIQLRYALSQKLSVEAEAGTRSAISLFYTIVFD